MTCLSLLYLCAQNKYPKSDEKNFILLADHGHTVGHVLCPVHYLRAFFLAVAQVGEYAGML
jgi:predicted AlkP superfamily pyrophosphatase or phosphodiesterase